MADACSICGGSGWIPVDDLRVKECRCKGLKRLRAHLGEEIALSPVITTSPLFKVEAGQVVEELSSTNVYIESTWAGLLPHLKLVLMNKGTDFYFRVITDELVKRVFVGAEHYQNKTREERETSTSYNSLNDLMGEVCDLVILRLGIVKYRNRALPGAIHEALSVREHLRLPTWVVSTPDFPFEESPSYSPELAAYLERRFKRIRLVTESTWEPEDDTSKGMSVVEQEDLEPPEEELSLVKEPVPVVVEDIDSSLFDEAPKRSKSKFKRRNGSGGGSGPLG